MQSACKALGLLEDERLRYATLQDAALSDSPFRIRNLLVIILVCDVSDPLGLWDTFKDIISEDYKHQIQRSILEDVDNFYSMVYNEFLHGSRFFIRWAFTQGIWVATAKRATQFREYYVVKRD